MLLLVLLCLMKNIKKTLFVVVVWFLSGNPSFYSLFDVFIFYKNCHLWIQPLDSRVRSPLLLGNDHYCFGFLIVWNLSRKQTVWSLCVDLCVRVCKWFNNHYVYWFCYMCLWNELGNNLIYVLMCLFLLEHSLK